MADVYTENMTRLPSEVERLDQQFDLMTENMGYIIHPSITLPSAPRVADMATGTARFLISLHPKCPEALMEGFDISSALYPPQNTLPSTISLSVLDVKQPFPEHMHEQYDLVHVRLLVTAMRPDDWEPTVRNLSRILRPGGYIQWEECDFLNAEWLKGAPDARTEKTKSIGDAFRGALRSQFEHGWNTLPECMRAAGLTSIISDIVSADRVTETRERLASSMMTLVFTWARMMVERGTPGPMFDDLDGLEKAVRKEIKSGCYFKFNIYVACAQKPQM
ncbi:hypothetical protein GGR55DRAFT_619205 [Xylaria sp. FL0064]|nr:hypothetical protein GGR55DRAFT_619205 [Xylaria sp. FL0064]